MWAKCPCDIFRKYVVNSHNKMKKKTLKRPQQFEHTPFRNTL